MGFLALIAVVFSGYKAVSSLSGNDSSPDYRRSPPSAFAMPLAETIVDPQKLTEPRLPDEAYSKIEKMTQDLSAKIAKGRLTAEDLIADGMSTVRADATARQVASYDNLYAGRTVKVDGNLDLGSVTSTSAQTSQTIEFGVGAGDSPGGSFTITYDFSTPGDPLDWDVTSVDLQF